MFLVMDVLRIYLAFESAEPKKLPPGNTFVELMAKKFIDN
jgi:hypothetical protein